MRKKEIEQKKKKSVVFYLVTLAVFIFAVTLLPVLIENVSASSYQNEYKKKYNIK